MLKIFEKMRLNRLREKIANVQTSIFHSYTWEIVLKDGADSLSFTSNFTPRSSEWCLKDNIEDCGIFIGGHFIPLGNVKVIRYVKEEIRILHHFEEVWDGWLNNYLSPKKLDDNEQEYLDALEKLKELEEKNEKN